MHFYDIITAENVGTGKPLGRLLPNCSSKFDDQTTVENILEFSAQGLTFFVQIFVNFFSQRFHNNPNDIKF